MRKWLIVIVSLTALDLATKLETQYSGAAAEGGGPSVGTDITIWADEQTNALVITAPPKVMRSMMSVIDKLDIRRAQVMVEAIIVEVSADKSAELGITWAVFNDGSLAAVTNFPGLTPGVVGLAGAIEGEAVEAATNVIGDGTPESCTSQAVVSAVAAGGIITFEMRLPWLAVRAFSRSR